MTREILPVIFKIVNPRQSGLDSIGLTFNILINYHIKNEVKKNFISYVEDCQKEWMASSKMCLLHEVLLYTLFFE